MKSRGSPYRAPKISPSRVSETSSMSDRHSGITTAVTITIERNFSKVEAGSIRNSVPYRLSVTRP